MVGEVAGIAACFPGLADRLPASARSLVTDASPDDNQQAMAAALKEAGNAAVLLGNTAAAHPQASLLRALATAIAEAAGAVHGCLPQAANSAGGWLAGAIPHRGPAGDTVGAAGLSAHDLCSRPRKAYVLFGVEPEHDCWDGEAAMQAMAAAEFVVSLSPWASETMMNSADVLLPVTPFTETSGTFVNLEGRWQGFSGVARPYGDSRPGWKVLRVLGNLLELDGFEYNSSEEVRDALHRRVDGAAFTPGAVTVAAAAVAGEGGPERIGDVPIHASDALVRRAASLQATPDAVSANTARISTRQAEASGVLGADSIRVSQDGTSITVSLEIDERVPAGCIWLPAGTPAAAGLGPCFGSIRIERA
jgi:NADH-quinone oxidoreductase subunit G